MSDRKADRPGRAMLVVLAIAAALIIPAGLVTSQLSLSGQAEVSSLKVWGSAALVGLAAAAAGVSVLGARRTRPNGSVRIALFAMGMVTFLLLVLLWQIVATTANHGTG